MISSSFAEGYKSARNGDPQGQIVRGIRYALSALGHHWFFAVGMAGGYGLPARLPIVGPFAVWVSVDALPSFDQQASFRADYENHLARKSVQGTLAQAQAWFERAREDFTGGIG